MTQAPLGEFELIATYFAPMAAPSAVGLVDDAASFTPPPGFDLVLTKDALVAGVHFFPDDPPRTIAQKALRVNLSDLAAKGARPAGFLLGLGMPKGWTEAWLAEFAAGLGADAAQFSCPLYGGDTVAAPVITLSITAFGLVPSGKMVRRGGAQAGDLIYVSGSIGDGALGLGARIRQRQGERADAALVQRYLVPEPRMALAPALVAHAHAAMDVSDGLIGDAAKMAAASGCGLRIEAAHIPLSDAAQRQIERDPALFEKALTGGDDYEILAAIPPDARAAFEAAARNAGVAVTAIGTATGVPGIEVQDATGAKLEFAATSFRHF